MDQASRSSEPRERAPSLEPCATRPNPFDEGDLAARKRQRTSLSGSRSRSVETIHSARDGDISSSTTLDNSAPDSTTRMDTDPATPQTPEQQSAAEPPAEPPSSRVTTINLRNNTRPSSPSSPPSPTPRGAGPEPADDADDTHDIKASVEDPEVDMIAPPVELVDTPASSSSGADSPELVVSIHDEEETFRDSDVAIIDEDDVIDPCHSFPYNDIAQNEANVDTVQRLKEYLSSREHISSLHVSEQ